MSPQLFAWLTAVSFAFANISVRRGMDYSTPLTATFVSLVVHTVALWIVVALTVGIPEVAVTALVAIVVTGIVQPIMRHCHYTGIHKIGVARRHAAQYISPPAVLIGILILGADHPLHNRDPLVVIGIVFTSWRIDQPNFFPLDLPALSDRNGPDHRGVHPAPLCDGASRACLPPSSVRLASSFAMYYACRYAAKNWFGTGLWPFLISGVLETTAVLLMLFAFTLGPVVIVSPIASTTPIWTAILSAIFLRKVERINLASVIGTVCVVAGVIAISLVG
jgi:uncharacterized membrane protein